MMLRLTVVILVSVFIQRYVVSQKTTLYYDEYEDSETRFHHLHSEMEVVRQMMTVQERQISEMRILLEAVHRFMEQLLTNNSTNDCFQRQPTSQPSYLTSGTSQSYHTTGASNKSVGLMVRLDISDRWVYGVTKLQNLIYVLCYNPNSIMVCEDKAPFALREIETPQIRSPYNIVASHQWNCLFVIDIGNHCIWKVSADNDTVSLWLSDLVHVTALSVTNDGHVLIINQNDTSYYLEIYGPDAVLTDRIHIDLRDHCVPYHAVQTSTGGFIVCHKEEDEEDGDFWWISKLDAKGIHIKSSIDEAEGEPWGTSHMFIDSKDRLFVADRWRKRVMVFDTEMNWNQTVLSKEKDGVQIPLRIYYDDKEDQLIVISGSGGEGEQVDIYNYEFP